MNVIAAISTYFMTNTVGKNQAKPFLESLVLVRSAKIWVVCRDFEPTQKLTSAYPYCEFVYNPELNREYKGVLQHGGFLYALPWLEDDEIVLTSDADAVVQRDFTAEELALVTDTHTMSIGPNCGDDDTLAKEGRRIGVNADDLAHIPCYNCGYMMGSVKIFKRLQESFEATCPEFYKLTDHPSRSQLLVCKCWHDLPDKNFVPMPRTLHTHRHFGLPPGVVFRDGKAYHNNQTIMFRHAF